MNTQQAADRYRKSLLCLLFSVILTIASACAANPMPLTAESLPLTPAAGTPLPEIMVVTATAVDPVALIPNTSLEISSLTGCPDWDITKMYEYGEYLYGRTCAGCHGRQGHDTPYTNHFPALNGSTLAVSEDISHSLHFMMNTNIHPHASTLFEKDALAVINYIRITAAGNTDLICPGEYVIEINP